MGLLGERLAQRDVAIGIVLALSLGFGLLFLHFFTSYATQATALLFGNVLAVDAATVWMLLALGVVSVVALAVISRPLLFASLQPELAEAKGVSLRLYLRAVPGDRGAGDRRMRADRRRAAGVRVDGGAGGGGAAADHRRSAGSLLSAVLALAEAWLGITLAFYTDWPSSFWITALSAGVYLLASIRDRIT